MATTINHRQFLDLLTERFPEVVADIDDCSKGLLHLEMATFARATQAAINADDFETINRHFQFADEVYRHATPDVDNAINVSYLENLDFDGRNGNRAKARKLLPPRLQTALTDLEVYLARLFGENHT